MDGDEPGNRNIEACCSISGRRSCGAYLGHWQCECQGEVARGFVGAKEPDIRVPALCQEL